MAGHRHVIDAARKRRPLWVSGNGYAYFQLQLFSRPLGENGDIVTKENYSFTDRGGEMLTLRPENTAGVVRAMISGGITQSLPLRFLCRADVSL